MSAPFSSTRLPGPDGAFGERLGRSFHLKAAPCLSTTTFARAQLAVTRLTTELERPGMSQAIAAEDSFLCELHLKAIDHHETWCGGRLAHQRGYERDSIAIVDLRDDIQAFVGGPLDVLSFHLPRAMLDEFADDIGATRIQRLHCEPGITDPVMAQLGAALLPALCAPGSDSQLFFDHLALAIGAHLLQHYGGLRTLRRLPSGSLSKARERQAKELLASRLDSDISIAEVASACGLSRAHFTRAFRQSTGTTPHKWLQTQKVNKVKQLLSSTALPIAEIAAACGFADQSHLTRTFTQMVRVAPAAWRRQ
jgi:AraC-like DNA-binding protein